MKISPFRIASGLQALCSQVTVQPKAVAGFLQRLNNIKPSTASFPGQKPASHVPSTCYGRAGGRHVLNYLYGVTFISSDDVNRSVTHAINALQGKVIA